MSITISVEQLVVAGVQPTQARLFAEPLAAACERFSIDTPPRFGAFLGQCLVESAGFTRLEENLCYTTAERIRAVFPSTVTSLQQAGQLVRNPRALANVVYADKNGNGNPASGDGWAYRGRGLIQLTGRHNYAAATLGCGVPYLDAPHLVALPEDACLTAAWFFASNGLRELADAALTDDITRRVSGPAMREADLRRQYTEEATRAFA